MRKHLRLLFFCVICIFLIEIFSNVSLCESQEMIDSQKKLTQSSSEKTASAILQVEIYRVDTTNLRADVRISYLAVWIPENLRYDSIAVYVHGGGTLHVLCSLLERRDNYTSYCGSSELTTWFIGGTPELYPFDSYYAEFFLSGPRLDKYDCTLEDQSIVTFAGVEKESLRRVFFVEKYYRPPYTFENGTRSADNYTVTYSILKTRFERNFFGSAAFPLLFSILLAYVFLGSSFLIKVPDFSVGGRKKDDKLRVRLMVYVALFAFSIGVFFPLQSMVPTPYQSSLIGITILNLSICVLWAGILSIFANKLLKNLDFYIWILCFSSMFVNFLQFPDYKLKLPIPIIILIPIFVFLGPITWSVISRMRKPIKKQSRRSMQTK